MQRIFVSVLVRYLLGMTFFLMVTSCRLVAPSHLQVDNGIHLTKGMKETANAVFFHSLCTGYAVSDNTMLTASHCWLESPLCVKTGKFSGACALKHRKMAPDLTVFNYPNMSSTYKSKDIAVAVFPDGTFDEYFAMDPLPLGEGRQIVMAGYSDHVNDHPELGDKRFGWANVSAIGTDTKFYYAMQGDDFHAVGSSPGDSGGPMFTADSCKIAGTVSGYSPLNGGTATTFANHHHHNSFFETARSELGAEFCGLPGANPKRCNPEQILVPNGQTGNDKYGRPMFPCSIVSKFGSDIPEDTDDDRDEGKLPDIEDPEEIFPAEFQVEVIYGGKVGELKEFTLRLKNSDQTTLQRIEKVTWNVHATFGDLSTYVATDASNQFATVTYKTYASGWQTGLVVVTVKQPNGFTVNYPIEGPTISWSD